MNQKLGIVVMLRDRIARPGRGKCVTGIEENQAHRSSTNHCIDRRECPQHLWREAHRIQEIADESHTEVLSVQKTCKMMEGRYAEGTYSPGVPRLGVVRGQYNDTTTAD